MDSLIIFELQIVFYFQLFLSAIVPHKIQKDKIIDSLKYIRECMKKTKYGVNEI